MARKQSPESAALAEGETKMEGHSPKVEAMIEEPKQKEKKEARTKLEQVYGTQFEGMKKYIHADDKEALETWEETMAQGKDLMIEKAMSSKNPEAALKDLFFDEDTVFEMSTEAQTQEFETEDAEAKTLASEKSFEDAFDNKREDAITAYLKADGSNSKLDTYRENIGMILDQNREAIIAKAKAEGGDALKALETVLGDHEYLTDLELEAADSKQAEEEQRAAEDASGAETEIGAEGMQELKKQFDVVASTPDIDFTWDQLVAAPEKVQFTGLFGKVKGFFNNFFGGKKSARDEMIEKVNDAYYQYELSGKTKVKPIGAAYKKEDAGSKTKSELGQ